MMKPQIAFFDAITGESIVRDMTDEEIAEQQRIGEAFIAQGFTLEGVSDDNALTSSDLP